MGAVGAAGVSKHVVLFLTSETVHYGQSSECQTPGRVSQ